MKRHSIFVPMTLLGLLMFCAQHFLAAPPRFGQSKKKSARQLIPPAQKRLTVRPSLAQRQELERKFDALPLRIEALEKNSTQERQYIARGSGYLLQFAPDGMSLTLMKTGAGQSRGAAKSDESIEADLLRLGGENRSVRREAAQVGLRLAGANKNARVEALEPLPGTSNYFIGKDPAKWQTRVPNFSRLRVREAYEGIDLVYYGNQRKMEFDFVVAPGADPKKIALNVAGAKELSLSSAGDLWLTVPGGKLRLHKPVLYQEIGGQRKPVDGRFWLRNKKLIAFHVGKYDRTQPLVIDPVLSYSTFFGGSSEENSLSAGISGAVALDSSGNVYLAGSTVSPDFPFTPGVVDDTCGTDGTCNFGFADIFVTKLNSAGNTVLYSTFFGGSLDDLLGLGGFGGLDVDASGNAYLAGATRSPDFPTLAGAFDASCGNDGTCDGGRFDAFLLKLNSTGNVLLYSSFYGGSGNDLAGDVREDGGGGAYFTGFTTSTDLPLVTAFQGTFGGVVDAFIARINITGSGPATFSTYLGGGGVDAGIRLERDASGNVYVTGRTESLNFPTTVGTLQPLPAGAPTYKTSNSGASWTGSTSGTNEGEFLSIALAPSNPLILFAGSGTGVYKSTDAGVTWTAMNTGLPSAPVHAIAIDPLSPLIVYAGTAVGVYKTTDGGANWAAATSGIGSLQISSLVIDPGSPNILYAGLAAGAVFKSTNSASSWTFSSSGMFGPVNALALDPTSPSILYAGTDFGVFKSTNGASSWTHTSTGIGFESVTALAVNPTSSSTVYAGTSELGFFKSTNGGGNWTLASSGLSEDRITSIVVDPISSSILYAGTRRNGVFKSTNDAGSWTPAQTGLTRSVNALAIDAAMPSTLYAATRFQDAFLFRITNGTTAPVSTYLGGNGDDIGNGIFFEPTSQDVFVAGITASTDLVTTGSALQQLNAGLTDAFVLRIDNSFTTRVYATYLGGSEDDRAIDVAVNSSGEAWVVGATRSFNFPLVNSLRPALASDQDEDAFIAKLNSSGGALLFSTYWGSTDDDVALSVALDASGNAHVAGYTTSEFFPAVNALQSFLSGNSDAFLMKIADAAVFADLSVTGSHSPEPVPFGQPVTFTFSVTNNGPNTANNVFVYGTASNQAVDVFLTSSNPSQGTCFIVNNLVCTLGALANGATATISITGFGESSGVFLGTLAVGADESDPNPTDNTATEAVTFLSGADLGITQSITPNSVQSGATVSILLRVAHVSGDPLTGVTVTDTLPAGFTFVSASASQGTCSFTTLVTCSIGNVAIGGSATITIQATVSGSGSLINTATATANEPDPFSSNNSAIATVTVLSGTASEKYLLGDREDAQITVRNVSNDALVSTSFAGVNPDSIAVSPNGRLAFVANINSSYVSVVDLTINREISRVRGVRARQLAFTGDGLKVVAVAAAEEKIFVINPATLLLEQTISLDGLMGDSFGVNDVFLGSMAVAGARVYLNTFSNIGIVSVDLTTEAVNVVSGTELGIGRFDPSISATADQRHVVAVRRSPNNLFIIDTSSDSLAVTTALPGTPFGLAATRQINDPDGQHGFILAGGSFHVVELDSASPNFGTLLGSAPAPFSSGNSELALSADGNRLYFVSDSLTVTNNLAIIDTNQILSNPGGIVISQTRIGRRLRAVTLALTETATPIGAPTITSFSPATMRNDGQTSLIVNGTNFASGATLRIGKEDPLPATMNSSAELEVLIPQNFTASLNPELIVTNPGFSSLPSDQHLSALFSPGGGTPLEIQSPANYQPLHSVVTSDLGAAKASVLDANLRRFVSTPLTRGPIVATIEPTGTRAYFEVLFPDQRVLPFNLGTLTEETAISRTDPNTLAQGNSLISRLHPTSGNAVVYAIDPIFVSVGTDDRLMIIDAQPGSGTVNQVIATISSGITDADGAPTGLAATPNGQYVYAISVNSTSGDRLLIFNVVAQTATSVPLSGLGVSNFQGSMQVSPDGLWLILETGTGSVKVFDIGSNPNSPAFVDEISGLTGDLDVYRVIPGTIFGDVLAAFDPELGEVQLFEFNPSGPSFAFLNSLTIPNTSGSFAGGIGVSPNNQYLYLPLYDHDAVQVIDLQEFMSFSPTALLTRLATTIGPSDAAVNPITVPNTDLSVTLTDNTDPTPLGANFSYFLVVTNNGGITANNVTLSVTMPPNVSLGPIFPDQGSCTPGATVVCNLGSIGPSGVVNVGINLTATSFVPLTTSASLTATEPDPDFSNNTATETTSVTGANCTINFTNGGGTFDWNLATNWDLNRVPGAGDDVCIPTGFANATLSTGSFNINSLSASSPLIVTGGTLTIAAPSVISDTLAWSGGTLAGAGSLTLNGNTSWTGGTWSGSGQILVPGGVDLTIGGSGPVVLTGRTLDVFGTMHWSGTTDIQHGIGAVLNIQASASFDINSNQSFVHNQGGAALVINSSGTIHKAITVGTTTFNAVLNNSGHVFVEDGTIVLTQGGVSPGIFQSENLLIFDGGTHDISGATFTGTDGVFVLASGTLTSSGGTVFNNVLNMNGGTLTGVGAVTFNSTLNWTGGTMSGSGSTLISSTSILEISPSVGVTLQSRTIDIHGLGLWINAGNINHGIGAILNIHPGAFFNVQNDATFAYNQGGIALTINNSGTFTKDTGIGTTIVDAVFNNTSSGLTRVNTGTLDLRNGGSSAGIFSTTSGALLLFNGGTHTLSGAVFIDAGTVRLQSGTLTNTSTTSFFSPFEHSGGTQTGTGSFSFFNSVLWSGGTLSGSGQSIINTGNTLTISGSVTWQSRTLTNAGTVNFTSGTINHGIGAVLDNQAGALFDIQGDFSFSFNQGGVRLAFNNAGTLKKSAGVGTANFDPALNNSGLVEVQAGVLNLVGGGTSAGTFIPLAGTTLLFNSSTFDLTGSTISAGGGSTQLNSGTLTSTGPVTVDCPFNFNGGTLTGTGTFTFNAPLDWLGGSMTGSGSTVISSTGTLHFAGATGKTWQARTVENFGTVLVTGTGNVNHGIGAVLNINSGAMFDLQADMTFAFNQGGTRMSVNNHGTITKSSGVATSILDVNLNGSGDVSVTSGTLQFTGGTGSNTGNFSVTTTLEFAGGSFSLDPASGKTISTPGAGTINFSGGNTSIGGIGNYFFAGTTRITGGTVNFNHSNSFTNVLDFTSGTLSGTGIFYINVSGNWSGGAMTNTGLLVVSLGATLDISGAAAKTWTSHTLTIIGTARITGTGNINHGVSAFIDVQAGATLDIQADMTFAFNQGGGRLSITNNGTLGKSGGAGTATLDVNLSGSGDVTATSGTLQFVNGTGTTTGDFSVAFGATIAFSGSYTINPAAGKSVSGAGTIRFNGGTTSIGGLGTYSVTGLTEINGGTANFILASSSTDQFLHTSGNLGGSGTLVVNTSATWSGGTLDSGGGTLEIASGATLDISTAAGKNWLGHTLTNNGIVLLTGTGNINHGQGGIFNNQAGATFDIQADMTFAFNQGGARLSINNNGTLTKTSGAGQATLDVNLNGNGDVNVASGILQFQGGTGTSTGNFAVASGTTLDFNGAFTLNPAFGKNISGTGILNFNGGTTIIDGSGGGTFSFGGLTTITGGTATFNIASATTAMFSLSSGALTGSGMLTVTNSGTWSGATLGSGGGTLEIVSGATLDISSANGKSWVGFTISNAGTVTVTGTGNINHGAGAVFTNQGGATFGLQADMTFAFNQGGARLTINNFGTLLKSAGTGTTTVDVTLNNDGDVNANSGTLRFTGGGGTSSGNFSVASGATLDFNGGTQTITLGATKSFSGAGTMQFSGGNLSIGGTGAYTITGLTRISGAVVNFNLTSGSTTQYELVAGTHTGSGSLTIASSGVWTGGSFAGGGPTVIASGAALDISGAGAKTWLSHTITNNGFLRILPGAGNINHGLGGILNNQVGAQFEIGADMTFAFNQGGARLTVNNQGTLVKSAGAGTAVLDTTFNNSGNVQALIGVLKFPFTYTQTAGFTTLNGGGIDVTGGFLNLQGGFLEGNGTITGNVTNAANVTPGLSAGALTITGNYSQSPAGALHIEIGGLTAGMQYDQVNIGGSAILNGALNISYFGGFLPVVGNSFTILTYASSSGAFTTTNGLVQSGVTLQANQGATTFVLNTTAVTGTDADLSLGKGASHDPVTVGNNVTYTLGVFNAGPAGATNVLLTDNLPGGVTLVSVTPDQGSCSGTTTITCNLGTINANSSASVRIVVTVNSTGTISNTASVTATENDPNSANNSAQLDLQGVAAACSTAPSGLVSWWRSELTAKDSFSSNHGSLQNGAGFAAGKRGQAFSLNGVNQFVQVPDSPVWTLGTSDFTIDAWVNFNSAPGGTLTNWASTFVAQDEGPFNVNKWVFALGGGILFFHVNSPTLGPQFLAQTPFTPQVGRWYHLAVRRTGTTIEIYVDGILVGSQSNVMFAIPDVNFPLTIGQAENQGFLDGQIDEVEIFSRALSPAEILALHNAGTAGKCQFDAEIDFSVSANPNGAWSYGSLPSPGTFSLFTTSNPGSPIEGWQGSGSGPFFSHNLGQTTFSSGTISIPPRTVVYDPSFSGVTSSLRWIAPASGTYRVSALWEGRDTGGTTVDVFLLLNNNTVFTQSLSGFAATQSFLGNLTVQGGDTLDFAIASGAGVTNDTTSIEAIITPVTAAPPPVLQSVSPNLGSPAGGTPVTLTGQEFQFGATVTFGGVPATSVVVVSSTQITAVTPAGTGTVNVTVTNPDAQSSTLTAAFTFQGQADLAPTINDLVDPVFVGDNITYDISVTNLGPDDATNVVLNLALDPSTTFVSASAGCSHAAGVVTCTVGSLAADITSSTFQVVVATSAASAPTVNANLTATANEIDPNSSNDLDTEQTTVTARADLSLTKTASPSPAITQNNNLTYTLVVTNNGPSPATGVVLTDLLPAGVNFVSSAATQGSCSGTATVACNLGTLASGANATVTIIVSPPTPGVINNSASVAANEFDPNTNDNAASASTTVNVATADVSLTKTDAPDPVPANGSLIYTLTVSNAGPDPATGVTLTDVLPAGVTLVSASPNQGSCSGTATISCNLGTIAASGSAVVTIAVTPSAPGALSNTASVTANEVDPNLADNSAAAGTTVIIGPVISISTAILNFASQPVGTTSTSQSITISNTGSSALNIASAVINGDFAQTNTCGASLAAGASCFFFVTFTPTTTGTLSGTLTITHDAAGSPSVISFSGDGINAAAISLSTTSLVFGSRPIGSTSPAQSITLTNSGNATLNIAGIAATGDFGQTNTCGSTVAAGGSCVIDVTFTPTGSGLRTGGITVTSDARGSVPIITLTGFGVAQGVTLSTSIVVFGNQLVGTTSAAQNVTFTNNGLTLIISSITVAGDFAQTNNCSGSLATGASCTIQITFTPTAAGPASGSLTITDNGAGSPRVISLSGTGVTATLSLSTNSLTFTNQTVGTTSTPQSVTLTNTGGTTLNINSISATANFGQTNNCGSSLNTGASCTIQVTFTPTAAGIVIGSLTIGSSAAGSPHTVSLTGTGIATGPAVGLSTNSLTFAAQVVGTTSATQSITFTNSGNATLTIVSIAASGDFAQTNNCPASLGPGLSCVIDVTFTPTTTGTRAGAVTFTNDAPNSPQQVLLSGQGLPSGPAAILSPAALVFGGQVVNSTSAAQVITLSNSGNAALNITSIQISGDFAQTNTCGASVAAGASCTISVTFTPTASGSRAGALTITDNAPGSPRTVPLSGTGSAFTISLPPGSSASATVSKGQSATFTITLTPSGGFSGTVQLSCSGLPAGTQCVFSQNNFLLTGTTTVTVTISTTAPTSSSAPPAARPNPPFGLRLPFVLTFAFLWGMLLLLQDMLQTNWTRRRRSAVALTLVLCVAVLGAACAGGTGSPAPIGQTTGTPSGVFPITISATSSGGFTSSTTVTITVP